jgi:predicted 3-demethylubiquinone-9 3-methyltransferase (glyoxalase superfamily)
LTDLSEETADRAETDRRWNAIFANGGQESACGWSG